MFQPSSLPILFLILALPFKKGHAKNSILRGYY
jgi:hypothetical protein